MKGNLPFRRTTRIKEHDYSKEGCYFITINTLDRLCCFGHIEKGSMVLNDFGQIVQICIDKIPEIYPEVAIPCSAIMPDHIHFIVNIKETKNCIPEELPTKSNADEHKTKLNAARKRSKDLVPKIVQQFKTTTVRLVKQSMPEDSEEKNDLLQRSCRPNQMIFWHRGYYDRIIRNNDEFQAICKYITLNPANWKYDEHISSDIPD